MSFEQIGSSVKISLQFIKEKKMYELIVPMHDKLETVLEIVKDIQIEIVKSIQAANEKKEDDKK